MTSPSPRPIREQVSRPSHDESRIRDALDRGEGLTRHEGHELVDQIDRLRQAVAGSGEEAELAAQAAQHLDAEVRALRAELERHAADAHHQAGLASRLGDALDEARAALAARTPQPAELDEGLVRHLLRWLPEARARSIVAAYRDDPCGVTAAPQPAVPDGEDVPARLEAAADACEALGWTGTANTFRDLASQLREWDEEAPEVRAAVAAALARPTGRQP